MKIVHNLSWAFGRLVLFALLGLVPHLGLAAEKRVALVIGNSNYQFNPVLKNPANDASDMAASLQKVGFSVTLLIDGTRASMEKAVRDFGASLKGEETIGMLYYSGHGAQSEGQNYLLPVDSDIQAEDELAYKAVDSESILAKMRSANNKLNIVVLDACRNNPFPGASRAAARGLTAVKIKVPEALIIYSTDPGAVAADGDGRNSPFTAAFLQQLEVPEQDVSIMIRRVAASVQKATAGAQTPWVSSNLTQDFSFLPGAGGNRTPAPVAAPVAPTTPVPAVLANTQLFEGTLDIFDTADPAVFGNHIDTVDFDASENATYTLVADSKDFNTDLVVVDSTGTVVKSRKSASGNKTTLIVTSPVTDFLTAQIKCDGNWPSGAWTLSVTKK
ncbi:MAG: caspase family protein [Spirochaetales bacterium]